MGAISNVRITSGNGALTQSIATTANGGALTTTAQSVPLISVINDGLGIGIFEGTSSGGSYLFKSLIAGNGIVLTTTGQDITITANGGSSVGSFSGSLAAVAISGSYTDLLNKPTIPTSLHLLTDVNPSLAPTSGQVLTFNGTKWVATTPSGSTSLPAGTTQTFYFDVLFASSNPTGTANIPSSWNATIDVTNNVIVTTDSSLTGKSPFGVCFNFVIFDNTGNVTTQFAPVYPLSSAVGSGGYLSYDSAVPNQFTLVNFTASNIGFGFGGSTGAKVRVYVSFV